MIATLAAHPRTLRFGEGYLAEIGWPDQPWMRSCSVTPAKRAISPRQDRDELPVSMPTSASRHGWRASS